MKIKIISIIILTSSLLSSCTAWLDEIESKEIIPTNKVFSDAGGVKTYMAELYYNLPIEDFKYCGNGGTVGFNDNKGAGQTCSFTDEAPHRNGASLYNAGTAGGYSFTSGYKEVHDILYLLENLGNTTLSENLKSLYKGEAYFMLAYTYFALAKRYGGVPIIKNTIQLNLSDLSNVTKVPRSREKTTWDYTIALCDSAVKYLPKIHPESTNRRPGSYTANALKSRVALFAASVAKYYEDGASGGATDQAVINGLVGGMNIDTANVYYQKCIEACEVFFQPDCPFSLQNPTPSSPDEADQNLYKMFENVNTASSEMIFIKGYTVVGQGHYWPSNTPVQVGTSQSVAGLQPAVGYIERAFGDYTDDGTGLAVKIKTRADGNETALGNFSKTTNYYRYANPQDAFNGVGPIGTVNGGIIGNVPDAKKRLDARMTSALMIPGSQFRGITLNFQGGLIKTDGTTLQGATFTPIVHTDGKTYYPMGGKDIASCSGWESSSGGTKTGFTIRKFYPSTFTGDPILLGTYTNDYPDFRYAEILLNYAEAVVENTAGYGSQTIANDCVNKVRRRAGHKDNVVATANVADATTIQTIGTVQRERYAEFYFENKYLSDILRRRDAHKIYNNYQYYSLRMYQDLRSNPVTYLFVRQASPNAVAGKSFVKKAYYCGIDGVASNGVINNPGY